MWWEGFEPAATAPSEWGPEQFGTKTGLVGTYIPRKFDAIVRVLHPVDFAGSRPSARWSEYAEMYGTVVHPEVQWHRLVHSDDPDANAADGRAPMRGPRGADFYGQVLDTVASDSDSGFVTIGFWPGYGLGTPEESPLTQLERDESYSSEGWREAYYFRGPLDVLRAAAEVGLDDVLSAEWPNVTWPEDHSWFIFSEIDFDSTLVGCSSAMAARILADRDLEAMEVGPNSDLTCYGDTIN